MAVTFRWLYSRILCRWCRARRRDAELPPGVDRRSKGLAFDEIGKERYMPTDLVMVPITVNLILIFSFIFVGALAFASWEDWDPIASAYFCFITLTTIGYIIYTLSTHHIPLILISTNRFGDLYPQKAFLGFREDPIALMKMCFTVAYCIFGKQSYEDWIILFILFLFRDDSAVHVHEPDAGADCGESVLDCPRAWHEGRWQ